jgi:ABC-2 type transport system ATP-binding protein
MEEADRVARQVAVIDHGKIIATGTPAELKTQTQSANLEDAFIKLTGNALRAEQGNVLDNMRMNRRAWTRK